MMHLLQIFLWAALLGWLGLLCLLISVPYLAAALDQADSPVRSDYIVVLGGGAERRVAAAAQYYHYGYAPKVIFSCREDTAQAMATLSLGLGIPNEACLVEDDSSKRGTRDHPAGLRKLLGEEKVKSASFLVVTDWYHTRRVKATFAKAGFPKVRVCRPMWQTKVTPGDFGWRECWELLFTVYREWVAILVKRY